MKLNKFFYLMLGAAALTITSCNDIDEMEPESGSLTLEQVQRTNTELPVRTEASFAALFTHIFSPYTGTSTSRADNFGYVMAAISLDAEGADLFLQDNNYNWFSVAGELSSRNANYANPFIRYGVPYSHIGKCNDIINGFPEDTTDPDAINKIAQTRAVRAYAYMALAPYFQFGYATAADQPCVPLLTADVEDVTNNPRATVREVWEYIMADLNYAVEHLAGAKRANKAQIDQNVALGLRARANLHMGNWAAAAADAAAAAQGYEPASMAEVSVPAFCNLNDHNWMWGADVTDAYAQDNGYKTASSWISAFCGDGYAAATQNTPQINTLLWNKIPETDVRKGWWIDENLHSPNWANVTWQDPGNGTSATGDDIAKFKTSDGGKVEFLPFTNIKFGQQAGIGSIMNSNDFPLMRVEEMILIQAEGLAKSGNDAQAIQVLESFVKNYRDPQYSVTGRGLTLADEIWFQRRVELWGEGFFTGDMKRLGKPLVRFHGPGTSNEPDAFQFNLDANDGWLNMRFPQTEMNNNRGIVDNAGGSLPVAGQNPTLRDGVTD